MAWPSGSAARSAAASTDADSGSPGRQPELLLDDVDAGDQLADTVLDLEPGVDLEEVEGPVRGAQELRGRGVPQPGGRGDADRQVVEVAPLVGGQTGRRRLLDQFLVAPLERAIALADGHDPAGRVAEQLDLDVARRPDLPLEDRPSRRRRRTLPRPTRRPARRAVRPASPPGASRVRHRRPPPSPAAGSRSAPPPRGSPARASGRSTETGSIVPGTPSTPTDRASRRAWILSPSASMTAADGPTKTRPGVLDGTGERRPLGQEPVARMDRLGAGRPAPPRRSHRSAGSSRTAAAGPSRTATSAIRTCWASASASL